MTRSVLFAACFVGIILTLVGCGERDDDGPPNIYYGDTICEECGMIISDERSATATIITVERGYQALVFDDFNCQMNYEDKHSELLVHDRWSHDCISLEWIRTADAWFVRSPQLRTPMASHLVALLSLTDAKMFAATVDGETIEFKELWPTP